MDKNRLRLSVLAGDLAVRNGPVSSRVALLLRSAEGKPSFASISPMGSPDFWRLVGVVGFFRCVVSGRAVQGSRVRLGGIRFRRVWLARSCAVVCWTVQGRLVCLGPI